MAQQQRGRPTQTRERPDQTARPTQTAPTGAAGSTAIDLYRAQPVKTIAGLLEKQLPEIAKVIPGQIDPRRFARLAISLLNHPQSGKLRECTARSLIGSIMEAAQLGLELDRSLGHAYLVPYKTKIKGPNNQESWIYLAQLIVGYRGYIHMLMESGRFRRVLAHEVYDGDVFDMDLSKETILHRPCRPSERKGGILGCYSVMRYADAPELYSLDWMWTEEIEAIRKRSKAADEGPWVTDWVEMAKKTVIRRHSKTSDASPKIVRVAAAEEARDLGDFEGSLTDGLLTMSELAGAATDQRTKELEKKYTGEGGTGGEKQAGGAAGGKDQATTTRRPGEPALPGDPDYVAPTEEQGSLLGGVGREPGAEG